MRVCVRRGRCLRNRKHVRTFWSQLRRRRRCAASGSPVLSPAADSQSHSAQAEEEREEWEREQRRGGRPDRGRSQRSVSRERWVETMVVADSKLIEYHGSENVESYIFTIMNMVSSLGRSEVICSLLFTLKIYFFFCVVQVAGIFHDASIGNAIHVILVRLILLQGEEVQLLHTHSEGLQSAR